VQSSRRLEREVIRNVELMWLLGKLSPDFKTIADFRKDNGDAIRLKMIDESIERYLEQMAVADAVPTKNTDTKKAHVLDKIEKLKTRITRLQEIEKQLSESEDGQITHRSRRKIDEDSRTGHRWLQRPGSCGYSKSPNRNHRRH